jgi:hypothetical protein
MIRQQPDRCAYTSAGCSEDRTYNEGSHYGDEHDFIVVPERICSKDKKACVNVIRILRIYGERSIHSEQKTDIRLKPVRETGRARRRCACVYPQ